MGDLFGASLRARGEKARAPVFKREGVAEFARGKGCAEGVEVGAGSGFFESGNVGNARECGGFGVGKSFVEQDNFAVENERGKERFEDAQDSAAAVFVVGFARRDGVEKFAVGYAQAFGKVAQKRLV